MNKFKDSYNSKIDFRFLAFSNMKINTFESTYDLGKAFNGEMKASTNDQIDIVKTKKAFEMFKVEGITKETIKKCLGLFDEVVSNIEIQMVINYMNNLSKNDYFDLACKLFMFIVKKSLFGTISNKMAILIFNTIMYQNKTLPIIFYPHNMKSLSELINSGLSIESLKGIINGLFDLSVTYNTPHRFVTRDEIIEILLANKIEIETTFGVSHISLTGSFANGLYNQYSDVDLIVTLKDKNIKKELEKYLENKFEMPVDVVLNYEIFTKTADLQKYRLGIF